MGQMEQVLGNLSVNACQAMAKGGGRLTISARRVKPTPGSPSEPGKKPGTQKGMVAISVKDTGTGITPENLKLIFEPLFTTKSKGIGLGLAVSRKLAEANGGCIEVESEPGKGSTFTLYLPVEVK
jgi:two-component system NtrC family sensor kinase